MDLDQNGKELMNGGNPSATYARIPLSVPDRANLHLAGLPGSEPAAAFYNTLLRD